MALKKIKLPSKKKVKETIIIPTPIAKIAIDYPNEGINNLARKINEIIDRIS